LLAARMNGGPMIMMTGFGFSCIVSSGRFFVEK
jgi:hypothetical protein